MNWNVDHLPAFVAVADHGGISAAARHLAAPKSTVSRAVARLEEDVGLRLFVRGAKSLRLTHDGNQFYQHAIRIRNRLMPQAPNWPASVNHRAVASPWRFRWRSGAKLLARTDILSGSKSRDPARSRLAAVRPTCFATRSTLLWSSAPRRTRSCAAKAD